MKPYSKQVDSEPAKERDDDIETVQQHKNARRHDAASTQVKRKHCPQNHEQGATFLRVKAPKTTPCKIGPHPAQERTDNRKHCPENECSVKQRIQRRTFGLFRRG